MRLIVSMALRKYKEHCHQYSQNTQSKTYGRRLMQDMPVG
jgi:hypothetical protein